jgi:diguanylate cyclase (GGDEF)-like protein
MAAPQPAATALTVADRISTRRPGRQVVALTAAMYAATVFFVLIIPDFDGATRTTGWWAFVVVAAMFGLFEYFTFNVQFRREGIAFSMSEIPLAFALVFLAPWAALLARLPLGIAVIAIARNNRGAKLAFNTAIFVFEMSLLILVFRGLLEVWGDGTTTMLAAVVVALVIVAPLTSMLIALAISRYEGGLRARIVSELRATWWMYTVNAALGAMTVSLALIEPLLLLLAISPVVGVWYVLHSYGKLGQEHRDLDAVFGFAGRVGRTLDVNEIGDVAVDDVVRLCRADAAALVRFGSATPDIHLSGTVPVDLPATSVTPGWKTLIDDGRVQIVSAARLGHLGISVGSDVTSLLVAPLVDHGEPFALVVVVERLSQPNRFDEAEIARLTNIREQLAVSLRRGMLHEQLEFEARHDALTGLPARTLFEREVAEAVEAADGGPRSWVLMLDLDRFKEVNDTLGHHAGDELLVNFARRMSALLGQGEFLARLAGDEFAILSHRRTHNDIVEFANLCVRQGGLPVVLDGLEIVVTVSVGVAQITPDDHDAVQPMRRADIAMYNAKWQRTGVEFYRDEIDRRTPARLSMLGDLRTAIQQDELDVVYQPKLLLATGKVVGVEALVRWQHPTRGIVSPTEFIRVAEDTGLIKDLTDLVLARGIAMLREFQANDLEVGLAVNLSTHDLFDSRLPDRVRGYLESNGVDPLRLTLEITESSLFVDAPRTRTTIDELHWVGLRLAVDDFGTGYSSLSYLRRLPVHELKIDQSFVAGMLTDPQDEVIVRSTVDLGHNLGLLVVAEGVESMPVLEHLRSMGCDEAQGFAISQPLAADELVGWLRRASEAQRSDGPMGWVGSVN